MLAKGETDQARPSSRVGSATASIWSRAVLLFGILCLIKLVLLIGLAKYLFEIHWRISGQPFNYVNQIAFYGFALLAGLNLWAMATRCAVGGARTVRMANAIVLALGAIFIFLTFHEGDKNYLYPVMHGTLALKDLQSYLSLNFFFRPPFLALWLLAYAAVYYFMFRMKREHWMLHVTSICAGVYTVLCLRDLMEYRNALIAVDAIGLSCFLMRDVTKSLRASTWLILAICLASLFALFYRFDTLLAAPSPLFIVITVGSIILFAGVSALAWRRGFLVAWSWLLPFAFVVFLLFANANYPTANNYRNLLCLGLALPHYFLGEFAIAMMVLLAGLGYRKWRPTGSLWWLDGIILLLVLLALVDLRLSQIMGMRLDWRVLSLGVGETPKMMWRMAKPYLPALFAALAVVAVVYVALLRVVRLVGKRMQAPSALRSDPNFNVVMPLLLEAITQKPRKFFRTSMFGFQNLASNLKGSTWFLLSAFVLLGLTGQRIANQDKAEGESALLLAGTSPWLRHATSPPMNWQTFTARAGQLGMTPLPTTLPTTPSTARDLNVVLIFQESSYNKYLSLFDGKDDTQPLLSKYKDRMELFPNFFSSFAGSINARFATFTGLYPVRDYKAFTEHHVPVKSIFEILHDHGYWNSLFYSSFFDYTGFRDFLRGRDIDEMYDADTMPGERKTPAVSWGLRESETLDAIQANIKEYAARKQKFFLTYVPAAPHNPFDGTPERFRRYSKNKVGDFTPLYENELLYMDWVVSSIVDQLKDSGLLDHTLIIITDDHGEMLGENDGPIGHGWALTPTLANIPLIIMDPNHRGYQVNDNIGSQVDLLPTMLSLLGIPLPQDQLCQGASLYSAAAAGDRTIYLNTFQQYGIIEGRQIMFGDRKAAGREGDGMERIFKISNQGARTIFVPTNSPNHVPSIVRFDAFQENFLENYSYYCKLSADKLAAK